MKTEMNKLVEMLNNANIPFELTTDALGNEDNQVWYPSYENNICDVICHAFSYGGPQGYLEMMGLVDVEDIGDEVEGWLTADVVFERIKKDYEEN